MLVDVGPVSISYDVLGGHNPPDRSVLLCSGAGEGPELWHLALGPELVAAGHRVIIYSYRGIAPSSCPPEASTMADVIADAVGLLERLAAERVVEGPVAVAGYSSGGWVACEIARTRPELVRSLSTIAGIGRSPTYERLWLRGLIEAAEAGITLSPSAAATNAMPMLLGPSTMQDDASVASWHAVLANAASAPATIGHWKAWQEWAEGPDDKGLAAIHCPTQIVAFEHDIFLSPAMADDAADQLVAADVDVVIVDDCGHAGLFERADVVVPVVVAFLGRAEPAP